MTPAGTATWAEWDRSVDSAARRLRGLAPEGGLVAAVVPTTPAGAALVLGALRAGVTLAPLSRHLPPSALADVLARLGNPVLLREDGPAARPSSHGPLLPSAGLAVLTSGSAGDPKAALLPAAALAASADGVSTWAGLGPGDRWLLDLPLNHVGGLGVVIRCALSGAALVVPGRGPSTPESLAALGVTHASLVATQLYRLLHDPRALPSVRCLLVGGSAVAPALLDGAAARGLPVATSYGLTEMGSTVTATAPGAGRDELETAGRPLAGRIVREVDGEIRVGGFPLFAGYLDGGRLDLPVDPDGLFATGDLGTLDPAGRLRVTGRRGLRFISGGENVQPETVEAALMAIPGVARAVVVPVDDPEFGQRGVAFVEMTDGAAPDGARMAAALAERLPRFQIPARFHPWPAGEAGLKPGRPAFRMLADRLKTT